VSVAVTVLVPAHDDASYLDANLASLAAQTFGDFEAIVADDASSDSTPEIARAWAARDRRFRLSRVESNLGMNRNWNRALAEARAELVLKLDADDAMTPRALELLRAEHAAEPALLFAGCRTLDCDLDLAVQGAFRGDLGFRLHGLDPERRHVRRGLAWLRCGFDDVQLWHSCAMMFRRRDLVALGGWDERWIASDSDLILRALALDRPVAHVPEPGILYRRREGSSSHREHATGAARLELNMIVLRALAAHHERLRPLGRALRQNWWRTWRRFLADSRDRAAWDSLTPNRREQLRGLERDTRSLRPPLAVRLEGDLRHLVWRARRGARQPSRIAGDRRAE
jgi:glycosyltransferase involved in cell wall biosynthesis